MFGVGKFPEENDDISSFPDNWMAGEGEVQWPSDLNKSKKYARKRKEPEEGWKLCPVVVLGWYSTYQEAKDHEKLALMTSDLDAGVKPKPAVAPFTPPAPPNHSGVPRTLMFQPNEDLTAGAGDRVTFSLSELEDASGLGAMDIDFNLQEEHVTTPCCSKHEALILAMGKDLAALKVQSNEQTEMLSQILSHVTTLTTRSSTEQAGPPDTPLIQDVVQLPVCNVGDLKKLNDFVATTSGTIALKRFLVGTGGTTVDEAVQRTMVKLIVDEVMVQFSLQGMRGKKNFKLEFSALYEAINDLVLLYLSLSVAVGMGQADSKHLKDGMAAAFKKAYDRECRRKEKASKQPEMRC